jgi:hypothetical protein
MDILVNVRAAFPMGRLLLKSRYRKHLRLRYFTVMSVPANNCAGQPAAMDLHLKKGQIWGYASLSN